MSAFSNTYNKDNILLRSILVGLVNNLTNVLSYQNVRSNDEIEIIKIPFYYSLSGDERFLQDYFLNDSVNDPDALLADTNYYKVPIGFIRLNNLQSVNSSAITSRYARGNYTKTDPEGELKSYSAEFRSIPIVLTINVTVRLSTLTDMFKTAETIAKVLYKNQLYRVDVNGIAVPAVFKIPDDLDGNMPIDFRFDDLNKFDITFQIEVNTFIPVFDYKTEMFAGNRMTSGISGKVDAI